MLNNYICALDIGSSKIAACIAEVKRRCIKNMFFDSVPSRGVVEGIIVDSIGLVGSVSKLMQNLKAKSGINIKFIYTNISGQDVTTKHSRAVVALAERGNKVITVSDIQRVNEQARILGSGLEEEIIHLIPSSYTIDSKNNIINPVGLYSHKLEADLYLVLAKLSSLQSLGRAMHQSGYEIKDLFFSGLATSRAVFDNEIKSGINIFCDIGSDITELLVFRDGRPTDIEVLPLGGNVLTGQLQDELKISFDLAEDIKRSYGLIGSWEHITDDKEILVKKSNLYKPIKQKLVAEILTSRAKLICSHIKDAVSKRVSRHEVNNFVICGRTVLLEGFIETLEDILAVPVKLGRMLNPEIPSSIKDDSLLSGQRYLTYLTSLGIILEALQDKSAGILPSAQPAKNLIAKAINRVKEVYQEYF